MEEICLERFSSIYVRVYLLKTKSRQLVSLIIQQAFLIQKLFWTESTSDDQTKAFGGKKNSSCLDLFFHQYMAEIMLILPNAAGKTIEIRIVSMCSVEQCWNCAYVNEVLPGSVLSPPPVSKNYSFLRNFLVVGENTKGRGAMGCSCLQLNYWVKEWGMACPRGWCVYGLTQLLC